MNVQTIRDSNIVFMILAARKTRALYYRGVSCRYYFIHCLLHLQPSAAESVTPSIVNHPRVRRSLIR